MSEELKPCPFCGEKIEPPKSRQTSTDRSEGFVAFAACYCGGYSATAHKMGRGNTEAEAIQEVIALWNRRAQPAEAEGTGALDELLALFPLKIDKQAFVINGGAPLTADGDDEFLSFKKVDAALGEIRRLAEQGRAALSAVTAERDRLREALEDLLGCPANVVQATVPKAGIKAAPPYQVVLDVSVSLTRWNKAKAAMAAKEA